MSDRALGGFADELRAPVWPAVVPAGVILGARPADVGQAPEAARRMALRAIDAGWQAMIIYSRAEIDKQVREYQVEDVESKDRRKYRLVDGRATVDVYTTRCLLPGLASRWACWMDGKFDTCRHYAWGATVRLDGVDVGRFAERGAYMDWHLCMSGVVRPVPGRQ